MGEEFDYAQYRSYEAFSQMSEEDIRALLDGGGFLTVEDLEQLDEAQQERIFGAVSSMIHDFRTDPKTLNEMLDQPWQKLQQAFREGRSSLFCVKNGEDIVPIAHCAMWQLADIPPMNGQPGCRVYELGSWIVSAPFRSHKNDLGNTYGEMVADTARKDVYEKDREEGYKVASLATVKRVNSMRGLEKVGFMPESFHAHKLAAALTCTCPTTSEVYTNHVCGDRRTHESGETHHFIGVDEIDFRVDKQFILPHSNGIKKIPCTLMVHNGEQLTEIENILEEHYMNRGGEFLHDMGITPEEMIRLKEFYERLGVQY